MKYKSAILISFLAIIFSAPLNAANKLKPEELVAKNLDSIGSATAREAAKSRLVRGTAHMQIISGGAGVLDGDIQVSSQGDQERIEFKFPNPNYPGENFSFDGNKVVIGQIRPGVRSKVGTFLDNQTQIVREGLLGGELSTAWPLFNLQTKDPKLSSDGLKKIDGRELYQLGYRPRKGSDVEIRLYFDPETFHHVMTVYQLTIGARMGSSEIANAQQQETRIRLEERFDDFKTENGLTLPTKWTMRFTSEGGINSGALSQSTSIVQWDMVLQRFEDKAEVAPIGGK